MPFPPTITNAILTVPSARRRSSKRILIVDDHLETLRLTTELLREAGYLVVPCESGEAAITEFRLKRPFALLLSDFQMPGMNGIALANLLTGVARGLSVLVVSGAASEELLFSELWRKHWCFLAKPLSTALLLKTIDQLCGLMAIQLPENKMLQRRKVSISFGL